MDQSTTAQQPASELIDRCVFINKRNCLISGVIQQETEKAVKIDYSVDPISANRSGGVWVFEYTAWIPKSVLIEEGPDHSKRYQVKKWFENKFEGGHRIKKYFIGEGGKRVLV